MSRHQILDILCDKYDGGFQLRGRFAQKRRPSREPVVLLPSAYVNVSRMGLAYARSFPRQQFLLVTTRYSGTVHDVPENVRTAWLSSYAAISDRSKEISEIKSKWQSLLNSPTAAEELRALHGSGQMDGFEVYFRRGLELRDAWLNVLDREPVNAVLCADDNNPYTSIPLALARQRGLPNIACHHGALDGYYGFKSKYAATIWAKGEMEKDYLVQRCGVPRERIEIAAPKLAANSKNNDARDSYSGKGSIVFFSEPYECGSGRAEELYRDLLPPLADLALANGCEFIVKLHPSESERERKAISRRVLSQSQRKATRFVAGPLTEDLLTQTWFGITIQSTVALECAIRGIPCFLCKWLDFWPFGYVDQFIRFGVGIGLDDSSEIQKIPQYLQHYRAKVSNPESWWRPVDGSRLTELLAVPRQSLVTAPALR